MRAGFIVLPLILMTGCAATPPDVKTADSKSGLVCTRETPIGSNLPQTVCHKPLTMEERQRMEDAVDSNKYAGKMQGPTPGNGN